MVFRARFALLVAALLAGAAGCKSAETHRRDADRVAADIVSETQRATTGHEEPIEVQSPKDTLRRRLLIDQALPAAAPLAARSQAVEGFERFPPSPDTAVTPIPQFPDPAYLSEDTAADLGPRPPWSARTREAPMTLSLEEALQIAARNSRTFQTEKEKVFLAALALDLERDGFRGTWTATLRSEAVADLTSGTTEATLDHSAELKLVQKFKNGVQFTATLGLNLVRLMTGEPAESLGQFGEASISIPLLRGAGTFVVTEPLRQAERDTVYAIYGFERFKQTFAVQVASEFFGVLEFADAVHNTEESYRRLAASTRRARRLADAGRLPEIQVGQSLQDELRARDRWITTIQQYETRLDGFRLLLGLPPDAAVEPAREELARLVTGAERLRAPAPTEEPATGASPADAPVVLEPPDRMNRGPLEIEEARAQALALDRRLDLRVAIGRIDDAQRKVAVAADDLLPDLTLLGTASVGERRSTGQANQPDAEPRVTRGVYTGLFTFDPALERTVERNAYRSRLVDLERAVRAAQESEDQVKSQVRSSLRTLLSARESVRIQERALALARRRVESINLFLEAGRAEIRDLLEAQESLVSAENALTSAIVRYRVAELELQRDLGVLQVDVQGLWQEFDPAENRP